MEDDPLIAFGLRQIITQDIRAEVVVADSVAAAEHVFDAVHVDFALLDVNLRSETSYELARRLRIGRTPFVFTSGARRADVPDDLCDVTFLSKPCLTREIVEAIRAGLAGSRKRTPRR